MSSTANKMISDIKDLASELSINVQSNCFFDIRSAFKKQQFPRPDLIDISNSSWNVGLLWEAPSCQLLMTFNGDAVYEVNIYDKVKSNYLSSLSIPIPKSTAKSNKKEIPVLPQVIRNIFSELS